MQRKRVTKTLPTLIEKLKAEVKIYEQEHGVLLINGLPCLRNAPHFNEMLVLMEKVDV